MQARLAIHRHHLRLEENNFFNRLALKGSKKKSQVVDPSGGRLTDKEYQAIRFNERLAVNLLQNVI